MGVGGVLLTYTLFYLGRFNSVRKIEAYILVLFRVQKTKKILVDF